MRTNLPSLPCRGQPQLKHTISRLLVLTQYEEEPGRRSAAKLLTKDEARRIAANVAKRPELMPASAAHEGLHFLKGNGAIVVGIHCPEDTLLSRLKLLQ